VLHLFKKYQPYIALFVALYALLLYSHLLVLPSLNQPPAPSGILGAWVTYHLAAYSGWSKFLGLLLITGQALLINYIVNRYKMLQILFSSLPYGNCTKHIGNINVQTIFLMSDFG